MVRYYGYYSNKARGMRRKAECVDDTPALIESSLSSTAWRKNWARLIQKIYEVDPLLCPNCHGVMRIIAFIEAPPVIRIILSHLGLWETRNHGPPKSLADPIPTFETEFTIDTTYSQLPLTDYWDQQ
jgi:predicted TIM-barrel fold metal-dependent hydrolase